MKNLRTIGTGATIASFVIIALSGVGMFFGVKFGWIKSIHEYIGLVMVVAALLHIFVNIKATLGYFKGAKGAVISACIVILLGVWGYSTTLPRDGGVMWKKGKAYEKLVNMDVNKALVAFDSDMDAFNEFLKTKGLSLAEKISIKDFAKANKLKENEILDVIIK